MIGIIIGIVLGGIFGAIIGNKLGAFIGATIGATIGAAIGWVFGYSNSNDPKTPASKTPSSKTPASKTPGPASDPASKDDTKKQSSECKNLDEKSFGAKETIAIGFGVVCLIIMFFTKRAIPSPQVVQNQVTLFFFSYVLTFIMGVCLYVIFTPRLYKYGRNWEVTIKKLMLVFIFINSVATSVYPYPGCTWVRGGMFANFVGIIISLGGISYLAVKAGSKINTEWKTITGAIIAHFFLQVFSILLLRPFDRPWPKAKQIILGLTITLLLASIVYAAIPGPGYCEEEESFN